MKKFIGILLNILMLVTAYMSYTEGGLWDNGYNLMFGLYCVATATVVFICIAMFTMREQVLLSGSKFIKQLEDAGENLLSWHSVLFWVIAIPSFAFVGWWGSFLVTLISLVCVWMVKTTAKETVKKLKELCNEENITFDEMLNILDNKK